MEKAMHMDADVVQGEGHVMEPPLGVVGGNRESAVARAECGMALVRERTDKL